MNPVHSADQLRVPEDKRVENAGGLGVPDESVPPGMLYRTPWERLLMVT